MGRPSDHSDSDEVVIDKKKQVKVKKTHVFNIKLTVTGTSVRDKNMEENNVYEYNWKDLIKKEEEKKIDPEIEIIEIDDDPSPTKKKKRASVKPKDPEDDYDLDDDFIDDTEEADEEVPDQVFTEHGGFYINKGDLELQYLKEDEEDSIGSPLRKMTKLVGSPLKSADPKSRKVQSTMMAFLGQANKTPGKVGKLLRSPGP
jgi:hypothetical protein